MHNWGEIISKAAFISIGRRGEGGTTDVGRPSSAPTIGRRVQKTHRCRRLSRCKSRDDAHFTELSLWLRRTSDASDRGSVARRGVPNGWGAALESATQIQLAEILTSRCLGAGALEFIDLESGEARRSAESRFP